MHVLMIAAVWPEPASSGAGLRMMELMLLFRAAGWRVTCASTAADSPYMENLEELGVTRLPIRVNCSSFDDELVRLQPDMVLFERFTMEEQFGWRVEKLCPDAMRVVETIDLHCLRRARESAFKRQPGVIHHVEAGELYNETALREIAAMHRSDLSLIISDAEMDLLQTRFDMPQAILHLCPFMFHASQITSAAPDFEQREHFVTIGNFRHAPNMDAALWLKREIWPLIRRQLPEAELHVYGAYAPKKATALHNPNDGFLVKGRAGDVNAVMQQARICLAPLRFGAGIKTKLADAMRNGTPTVTTSVGAEGMHGDLSWSGGIADDAAGFAEMAVSLYRDQARWRQAQQNGFAIVSRQFDAETNGAALLQKLQGVRENLAGHRQKHFIGRMLRFHHQRSTEFMSRWIACKESRRAASAPEGGNS